MQIRYLDGPRLRRALVAACEYAQVHRRELNRMNVFPVPDGDTGTNLALTVQAIADRLSASTARAVSTVAGEAAEAAVLGARGNCGMMLSHFLLGFAEWVRGWERIGVREFGAALRAGATSLQEAIETPVEGTILTVIRETADAAEEAPEDDFAPLVHRLVERARDALSRTPELLPVLRSAGVVDAGAKGFVSLLEGVLLLVRGEPVPRDAPDDLPGDERVGAAAMELTGEAERYRFCTEALVRGDALPERRAVQEAVAEWGDSLIVIRSGTILKLHIHTDEPERVFRYLRGVGELVTHKAEDMKAQHAAVRGAGHIRLARRPVAVVTDSACDLPDEVVRAHGIHVTPLLLVEGDRTFRDRVELTAEEFHRRLEREESLPTTSQPAPADFLRTYRAAMEEGEAIVAVLLSSGLSGTFGSGVAAAERFTEAPVHVVDSRGASLLEGLLVLKACELAELGWEPERISREVVRIRERSGVLFTLRTFDRLVRSGRISAANARVGKVMGLRPLFELDGEGRVAVVGRAVGNRGARHKLFRMLRRRVPRDARVRFGVMHVAAPDVVAPLAAELQRSYGAHVEVLSAPATPVIATHLGPGAWGIAYMVED